MISMSLQNLSWVEYIYMHMQILWASRNIFKKLTISGLRIDNTSQCGIRAALFNLNYMIGCLYYIHVYHTRKKVNFNSYLVI